MRCFASATSIRIVRRGGEVNALAVAVRPSIRRLIRRGAPVYNLGKASSIFDIHFETPFLEHLIGNLRFDVPHRMIFVARANRSGGIVMPICFAVF